MKWSFIQLALLIIAINARLISYAQHRPYEPTANSILLETENLGNGIRAERYEVIFNATGTIGTQDVGFITVIVIDNAKLVGSNGTNQLTFITGNPPINNGNTVTNQFSRVSNGQVLDILNDNNIPVAVNGTFYNNEYLSLCCDISRFAIINGQHVNPGQSPLANNPALVQYSDGRVNHVARTSEVNVNDPNIVNFITLAKPENNPSTNFNNSNILLTDKGTGRMFVVQTNDAYSTEQLITWTQDNIGLSDNTAVGVLDPGSSTTSVTQNGVFHSPGVKGVGQWASGGLPMFIGVTPDGDAPTNISPAAGVTRSYGQSNGQGNKMNTKGKPGNPVTFSFADPTQVTFKGVDGNILETFDTQWDGLELQVPDEAITIEWVNTGGDFGQFDFDVSGFSGVDFTNLNIKALDVDNATKTVNLILSGNQVSGSGANLKNDEEYFKRVFLQALSIPTDDWYVSLETNPTNFAEATAEFKKSDMADVFFTADVAMKKEMLRYFNSGALGFPNLLQQWVNILVANNQAMFEQIFSRFVAFPDLTLRGTIVPQIAENSTNSQKLYMDNAQYRLDIELTYAELNLNGLSLTNEERNFLTGANWTNYLNWINSVKGQVASTVANRINASALPEYRRLMDILPVLVAAKWYKDTQRGASQYDYLIDSKLVDNQAPGLDLTSAIPFDQNYWNGQANQSIGTYDIAYNGSNFASYTVFGGIDNNLIQNQNSAISSSKSSAINEVLQGSVTNEGVTLINGGGLDAGLPNLVGDNFFYYSLQNLGASTTFRENEDIHVSFNLKNLGTSASGSSSLWFLVQTTDETSTKVLNIQNVSGVQPNEVREFVFDVGQLEPGSYFAAISVDNNNNVVEKNEYDNLFVIYFDVIGRCDGRNVSVSSNISVDNFYRVEGCDIQIASQVSGSGAMTVNADNRIVFAPGFRLNGSGVKLTATINEHFDNQVAGVATGRMAAPKSATVSTSDVNGNLKNLYSQQISKADFPNIEAALREVKLTDNVYRILPQPKKEKTAVIISAVAKQEKQVELTIVNAGEDDGPEEPNWRVYPNPSKDILYIDYKLNLDPSDTQLRMYDLQGQLVRNIEIDHTVLENNRIRLDINDLKAGSYILEAVGDLQFKILFIKE